MLDGQPDRSLFLSPTEPTEEEEPTPPGHGDDEPPAGPTAPLAEVEGGRRRSLAVLVVLALLVAGVVANRMGASDDGSSAETEEEAEEGATTATSERRRTTTSRRPARTTTTLPASLETIGVRGPLLPEPTGTTLVVASSGQLVVAHLDTGTVRAVQVPRLQLHGGYPFEAVLAVGGGLLTAGDSPQLVSRHPGGGVVPADVPVYGGYLPSAVEGRYWTIDHRFSMELVERGPDGPTGRQVLLPGESGAVIPVGDTFIISPFGSVMRVDASTGRAEEIAVGTAVAANDQTLARIRCDEALECGLVLSDLEGHDERLVGPPTPRSRYETYSGVRFSPDGRWLASPFYGEDQPGGIAVIDVAAGERRRYDALATSSRGGFPQSMAFTADSRWLLLTHPRGDGRPIRAIRLDDGLAVEIDLGVRLGSSHDFVAVFATPSIGADADADPPG